MRDVENKIENVFGSVELGNKKSGKQANFSRVFQRFLCPCGPLFGEQGAVSALFSHSMNRYHVYRNKESRMYGFCTGV